MVFLNDTVVFLLGWLRLLNDDYRRLVNLELLLFLVIYSYQLHLSGFLIIDNLIVFKDYIDEHIF